MKCICFLQNSEESLEALEEELREPKYSEYYLCQSVNPPVLIIPLLPFYLVILLLFGVVLTLCMVRL